MHIIAHACRVALFIQLSYYAIHRPIVTAWTVVLFITSVAVSQNEKLCIVLLQNIDTKPANITCNQIIYYIYTISVFLSFVFSYFALFETTMTADTALLIPAVSCSLFFIISSFNVLARNKDIFSCDNTVSRTHKAAELLQLPEHKI